MYMEHKWKKKVKTNRAEHCQLRLDDKQQVVKTLRKKVALARDDNCRKVKIN